MYLFAVDERRLLVDGEAGVALIFEAEVHKTGTGVNDQEAAVFVELNAAGLLEATGNELVRPALGSLGRRVADGKLVRAVGGDGASEQERRGEGRSQCHREIANCGRKKVYVMLGGDRPKATGFGTQFGCLHGLDDSM